MNNFPSLPHKPKRRHNILNPKQAHSCFLGTKLIVFSFYRLVPTMSPSLSQMRYNRQLPIDEQIHYGIRSSKDEAALRETSVSGSVGQKIKEKRFFFNANANRFVVSTTVTSFLFINTVVTQTVSLGAAGTGGAGTGAVICLPVGYLVCPVVG